MAKFKKDFDWETIERDNAPDEEIIYVSKSEIKRDAQDYRKLAEVLVGLNSQRWKRLGFDESLIFALQQAKDFKANEAKRRQIQYVSKLLRDFDLEELEKQIKATSPTQFNSQNKNLDKQIRVTIGRLQQPQFTESTLAVLAKQFADFNPEYVVAELEKLGNSPLASNSDLYRYFFDLYYSKTVN